jgi:hypothetical protein
MPPADSAADHPKGPADIHVLRRLRPPVRRFPASYPLLASAISETLARATQTHSVRANCSAQRHYIITTLLPGLAARLPPILPRIPMVGYQLDDRRLPFTWRGKPRAFGGYCVMMSSIAGAQPKLCRSAGGNPSNRSLRSKGRHSDGNATAPRIPPPFWSYFSVATSLQRIRVCAAVQVSSILRIPPRNSRNLMEASFATRTRRAPDLHTGTARILV